MTEVPHLTSRDVQEHLQRLYCAHPERRQMVAYFGTGDDDTVETGAGQFDVVAVQSELALREALLRFETDDAKVAFLVPWAGQLPLDIAGRFVQTGRIHRIGKHTRLQGLFPGVQIDEDVNSCPLVDHLLRPGGPSTMAFHAGRLTVEGLWEAWLAQEWRVPNEGGLALDTLVGWAATDPRGSDFSESVEAPQSSGVREALLKHLSAVLGPAAPLVWQGWEAGNGRSVIELAVLFEPLIEQEQPVISLWLRMTTRQVFDNLDDAVVMRVVKDLGRSVGGALRLVERQHSDGLARAIVSSADQRSLEPEVRRALSSSTRLPSAWRMRLDDFGRVLSENAREPSRDAYLTASAACKALEGHSLFQNETNTIQAKRAEMALRLLAWLVERPDRQLTMPLASHSAAAVLARWYVEDGAYVDYARHCARGDSDGDFGKGVQAIVDEVDRVREGIERQFTRAFSEWVSAGIESQQVVSIEQALKRIAVKFLDGDENRRLLVLLMDGMAWTQAVELLESLGQQMTSWGPLAWHRSQEGRIGEGYCPIVFAALPTDTESSRAAFFGGKRLAPGEPSATTKDPERFAKHPDLRKFFSGTSVPQLLLRNDSHTQSGAASESALTAIRDKKQRIVGIVINAIDDALKAGTQENRPWNVQSIHSLAAFLEAAREAGRSVLVASDHGHVPGTRLQTRGQYPNSAARYRPWISPNEAVAEYEIALSGPGVHSPKGAHGLVLLADETSRYGNAFHAGEHGGATMAEVVVPCLLIGCDDRAMDDDPAADRALRPLPAIVPSWWHGDVAIKKSHSATPPVKAKKAPKEPDKQLSLLGPPPTEAPPKPAAPAPTDATLEPDMNSAFAKCEVLKVRARDLERRKQVVAAVQFLLARNGVAAESALAQALGVLTFRVRGLVSALQEVLNVEGYPVLTHDTVGHQVRLDSEKLSLQFEVTL